MGMKILIEIFFALKKDSRTREDEVELVKDKFRLDIYVLFLTEDNK